MRPTSRRPLDGPSIVVAALLLAGCATSQPSPSPATATATATPGATTTPTAAPATAGPTEPPRNPAPYVKGERYEPAFDPANFVAGINHPFFPMRVGATFVFDGDEHVEIEVLAETKEVLGIAATVVRDRVYDDCVLLEDTFDWYGQDRQGNVWYLGEETAEYDNGEVVTTAGSWEAGVDGALPGIIMLAGPQAGDRYQQEFYEGEAEDVGEVTAVSGSVSVPAGEWSGTDVLVTEDWSPLEPGVRERKTYARGFGVVKEKVIKGGKELNTLTGAQVGDSTVGEPGLPCAGA
jgi:hypothetical protein